jgi:hypothetical protein
VTGVEAVRDVDKAAHLGAGLGVNLLYGDQEDLRLFVMGS